MADLKSTIEIVRHEVQAADEVCGPFDVDDPGTWHARRRGALGKLSTRLKDTLGARVKDEWNGAAVTIAGIRATSTSGLDGALSNWLAAADKRLAKEA